MKRNPSTLFAPGPGSDLVSVALVPMSPEILALYQACQRNAPWGTEVDDVLSADRLARGEREQVAYAQQVDPHDAMPQDRRGSYRAYVQQRRYAVKAYSESGIPTKQQAQLLGVSLSVIQADKRVLGLQNRAKRGLAGHTPEQVQALLDGGASQQALAQQLGLSRQAVSAFCVNHGLCYSHVVARLQAHNRREQVRRLCAGGMTPAEVARELGVSYGQVCSDRHRLGLPRPLRVRKKPTLKGHTPDQVKALLSDGTTGHALARRLGITSAAVYKFCKRAGLAFPATPGLPLDSPQPVLPTFRL
jgi:DNA invertase Pin-like site-specific DNA recombinase